MNEGFRIDQIRMKEVSIPFKIPFQISGGISYVRKSLIIELESEGVIGYGESAPFEAPFYSSETISSVKAVLKEWIFDRIIGKEIESIAGLNYLLAAGIRGNNFAKAGVENAYWDLVAKKNKLSLKELIEFKLKEMGVAEEYLKSTDYVESGVSIGIPQNQSLETFANWIKKYYEEGYQRIKIKIKPGWDLKPVEIVRKILGYNYPFWTDANSSYHLDQHLEIFKAMDQYKCLFHEQPLSHDDILDHLKLVREIETPICFDESLKSDKIAQDIVDLDISKIWNIKVQRLGGLWFALKTYKIAVENGVKLWGGTMPETGIGAMSILNLASFSGFKYPADVEPSSRWYLADSDLIEMEMKEGRIYIPEGLGIGDINKNNYERYSQYIWNS